MRIREMMQTDHRCVAKLYCKVFAEEPWNETWRMEDALKNVKDPMLNWWVIWDDASQEVIGFLAGCVAPGRVLHERFTLPSSLVMQNPMPLGYLSELGVSPSFRQRGYGLLLQNHFLAQIRARTQYVLVRTRPGTGNMNRYRRNLMQIHTYGDDRALFLGGTEEGGFGSP